VSIFRPRHGEHFAVKVFMAFDLRRLPNQVLGSGKKGLWCGASHGNLQRGESNLHYEALAFLAVQVICQLARFLHLP
jgi:hypothetical protein